MANILEKTNLTFEELGVSSGDDVSALFRVLLDVAYKEIQDVANADELEAFRVRWLGRQNSVKSRVQENWLKQAPPEARKWVGANFNVYFRNLEENLVTEKGKLEILELTERVDLSLPGVTRPIGTRHLISQTYEELYRIFNSIGFSIVEGAEIETPYYNFEALNIPEHHPARDNMDTFYLGNAPGYLLRTHTSPMQVRTMEKQKPPVRIVVPGKVYRRDNPDATHSFMFHQLEGLAVDTDITFCDFKGTIEYFAQQFFGPQTRVRLRPSYFPFTEPSAEFDASCHVCGGSGCRTCKYSGWIELFGAGMVDPAVYGFVDYDAKRLSGFAFGLGVDRLAMLKYGIDDLQQFFRNDTRFLRQFP
ncbi:MAG TPA: phenylalanine--tRNA ligase subunit alpha [Candidatus Acidoferrales bacterium]|jgi:phenylalanyl-tRNA synthetase alpha chain|nr:phenylalanine--tRNA ligase subunit alpha [Candidatus Acidoferrales bacterium]